MKAQQVSSVGYFIAVLAVLGIASAAVLDLYLWSSARSHHDWDADIDRIVAREQERKAQVEVASTGPVELPVEREAAKAEPATASALMSGSVETPVAATREQSRTQGASRKLGHRGDRRQHLLPATFAALPKFAATAATSTLLRLR